MQRSTYSMPRLGLQQHLRIPRHRLVDTFTPWELAAAVGQPPARVRSRSEPAAMLTIRSFHPDSVLQAPAPRGKSARCQQHNTSGFAPFTPLPPLQRRGYSAAPRWRSDALVVAADRLSTCPGLGAADDTRRSRPRSADSSDTVVASPVSLKLPSDNAQRIPAAGAARPSVPTPQKGVPRRCATNILLHVIALGRQKCKCA